MCMLIEKSRRQHLRDTNLLTIVELLIDRHLHEATLRADTLDADGRAGMGIHYTSCRSQWIPILIGIIEHRNARLTGVERRLAVEVDCNRIRWREGEG